MKVSINCAKCKSTNVEIIAEQGNPSPMYKCTACGYKANIFPKIGDSDNK